MRFAISHSIDVVEKGETKAADSARTVGNETSPSRASRATQPKYDDCQSNDCSDVEKGSSSESEEEVTATRPSRASRASAPKYDDGQSNDGSEFEKESSSESEEEEEEELIVESDDEPQKKRKASSKKVQEQDVAAPTEASLASNPLVAALVAKARADERATHAEALEKERAACAEMRGGIKFIIISLLVIAIGVLLAPSAYK